MGWTRKAALKAVAARSEDNEVPKYCWPWHIQRVVELHHRFYGIGMWTDGIPPARSQRLLHMFKTNAGKYKRGKK